jgi:hypothetical protein
MLPDATSTTISFSKRLTVALAFGIAFGGLNAWIIRPNGPNIGLSDFLVYWLAGKALLIGADPYTFVPAHYPPGLFAPATIGLIAAPFTPVPAYIAAPLFLGVGCAALAFAVTKNGWTRLWIFAASPVWYASLIAQVSPLLVGAALYPVAWGLLTAKPNLAIPHIAIYGTSWRRIVYGAVSIVAILALTFAIRPTWLMDWRESLRSSPFGKQYQIPMLALWGFVLWLPILRWRRPEARLVFLMACMPQNFVFYEQLPLLLVPQSRREMIGVAIISQMAGILSSMAQAGESSFLERNAAAAPYTIFGLYIPAIALVMLRSNQGPAPARIERLLARLPRFVRGVPA